MKGDRTIARTSGLGSPLEADALPVVEEVESSLDVNLKTSDGSANDKTSDIKS